MARTILTCTVLFAVFSAAAQTRVDILPPVPTTATEVVLRIHHPDLTNDLLSVTQTGNHFVLDFAGCHVTCILTPTASLGRLSAGTYTFEYRADGILRGTGSFVVLDAAAIAVPMSDAAMKALALLLASAALCVLRRP
jgi:hypothetical protein